MSRKNAFVEYVIKDLLSGLGGVEAWPMFGEHGLYLDGKMFGLITDDILYFKVNDSNRKDYESRDASQYFYASRGKKVSMPYWTVPDDILEDREELARWARASVLL